MSRWVIRLAVWIVFATTGCGGSTGTPTDARTAGAVEEVTIDNTDALCCYQLPADGCVTGLEELVTVPFAVACSPTVEDGWQLVSPDAGLACEPGAVCRNIDTGCRGLVAVCAGKPDVNSGWPVQR